MELSINVTMNINGYKYGKKSDLQMELSINVTINMNGHKYGKNSKCGTWMLEAW